MRRILIEDSLNPRDILKKTKYKNMMIQEVKREKEIK